MKNVENQGFVFRVLAIIASSAIVALFVAACLFYLLNADEASEAGAKMGAQVAKEAFCKSGDFSVNGLESIQRARENGECEAYLKSLIKSAESAKNEKE